MVEAPSGTVTFLFTDLEESTRLWEEHPDAMRHTLARHDALLATAVAGQDGTTVKTTGDGLLAAFSTADAALLAALDAQRALGAETWPETGTLNVRMGLHTGTAEWRGGDYFGPTLNRASRLMAAAHGGQIVCSQAVADLVAEDVAAGVELVDLGDHRLKDLSRPERVYQVWSPGLPRDFPPLRSLDAYPGNLPLQLTSFVGRDADLDTVTELLGRARVVTLVGPAGVGKTRLALQAAAESVAGYRDGTWFVDLAPVSDPALVGSTASASLGLADPRQGSAEDGLVGWLRNKTTLLVLDNCEHLVDATSDLVELLARRCPTTTLLVTSREALGLAGEVTYPVKPLAVPPADVDADAAEAATSPAVALFAERAAAARHGFELGPDNADAVAELCRRLDGIPLALELAAARVLSMSPGDILDRLDARFRVLGQGRRAGLSRHQTLRAAVDWSYELLDPTDQRVFARLAVFAGGFRLDAAEAVASGDGVDELEVLDVVDRLVARSMVLADDAGPSTRYRLLETLREYGADRLVDAAEMDRVRAAHADHYRDLAETAAPELVGADDAAWSARLDAERDNLEAALEWADDRHDGEMLIRLVRGLGHHWWHANDWRHGYRWFERAAEVHDTLAPAERADFLAQYGHVATGLSQWDTAREVLHAAVSASAEVGEAPPPLALISLSTTALEGGQSDEARAFARQACDAGQARGEQFWYGYGLSSISLTIATTSADDDAVPAADDALVVARELGNDWLLGIALLTGGIARHRRDPEAALSFFDEAIAAGQRTDRFTEAQSLFFRGIANLRLSNGAAAVADLERGARPNASDRRPVLHRDGAGCRRRGPRTLR